MAKKKNARARYREDLLDAPEWLKKKKMPHRDKYLAGTRILPRGLTGKEPLTYLVDEVFLGGAASQARLRVALDGLEVLWVGVRCDRVVAANREATRGDRTGMAESQADLVHNGVVYDLEVDTTATAAIDCARAIAART